MEANDIIQKLELKYSTCRSYRDHGRVVFDAPHGEKDHLLFSTLFKAPDHLVFEWQDYGPRRGKTEEYSSLWTLGGESWIRWVRSGGTTTEKSESLPLAQASAVGCSAGKVYAHSAHEAERTAREVAHKKMFEKSEEKESNVVELKQEKLKSVEF